MGHLMLREVQHCLTQVQLLVGQKLGGLCILCCSGLKVFPQLAVWTQGSWCTYPRCPCLSGEAASLQWVLTMGNGVVTDQPKRREQPTQHCCNHKPKCQFEPQRCMAVCKFTMTVQEIQEMQGTQTAQTITPWKCVHTPTPHPQNPYGELRI